MKTIKSVICALAALLALSSCGDGAKILPNVSGKAGEVLVVMEKYDWEGTLGTMLRDSLTADCPFLPQKEPLYNLVNVTPGNFSQMFQIHRNIIVCYINSQVRAPDLVCRNDKWAHPQLVISLSASSSEQALLVLEKNMHTIMNAIEQAERERVIANTRDYQERSLAPVVREFTGGGEMVFPSGYSLKKKSNDFLWISYETTYVQQGIYVYKYPSERVAEELSADALVARRNEVMRDNVPGMREGTYLTTSDIIAPQVKYVSYHNRKFAELRGFWDVQGDFMGGPFVSHSFYTPDGSQIICVEAYVYAPRYDKRHYLRQIESLLYSFEWKNL